MDLRKPKLSRYLFGKNSQVGVTNFITGQELDLNKLILKVEGFDNFDVMDSGPIPPNPSELLLNDSTKEMFKVLFKSYDHIIIDSAPIGLVADAFSFSDIANCSIYVAKFGYTKKLQMGIVQDIYQNKKLPNLGVVLNGVKKGGGYGYSRYGYSYSYYDQQESWWKKLKGKFGWN